MADNTEGRPAPQDLPPSVAPSASKRPTGRKLRIPKARRMRLSVTKVDPWSVAKVSFLLSIAWGIIQVICAAVLFGVLKAMGVFNSISKLISSAGVSAGSMAGGSIFSIGKILSIVTIFSVFEIILVVILATIGAFLYNVVCMLIGGVHVTLGDD